MVSFAKYSKGQRVRANGLSDRELWGKEGTVIFPPGHVRIVMNVGEPEKEYATYAVLFDGIGEREISSNQLDEV